MKIHIVGDIHGDWESFNALIADKCTEEDEHIVLVCGDFGYWPKFDRFGLSRINLPDGVEVYFCPGNHEDWDNLLLHGSMISEVYKNIFYCPFGSILTIDGITFLLCGGAESIDKHLRTPGVDWFEDESISDADIARLPDVHVDVVISHTCPKYIKDKVVYPRIDIFKGLTTSGVSEEQLNKVYDKYKPKHWFFGHFHTSQKLNYNDTEFHALDCVEHYCYLQSSTD